MPAPRLQLPTLQNWSCHNCSGCCRQHEILITEEERRRIEKQNWTEHDGIPSNQPVVTPVKRLLGKTRYRLAHQPDGACVFLNEQGLCRIHARFGEAAKPLACRIYPYAFHPAGNNVTVSLRFSCPSVVTNRGKPLTQNTAELKRLAELVVPPSATQTPPPKITRTQAVDWPDTLRFASAIDAIFAEQHTPTAIKLLRALFVINLVGQARFDAVRGHRIDELLALLREAATAEIQESGVSGQESVGRRQQTTDNGQRTTDNPQPSAAARMQFRMLCAQYARKDTLADLDRGLRNRWRLLRAAFRFARGKGTVPPLQPGFREVPFDALEQPFGPVPAEADEILTRYFRVKIQGLHFCGPAYYGVPLVEGFHSLALVYPVVLWLARWLGAGEDRSSLETNDIARALAVADHHHGYSPALAGPTARRRTRLLATHNEIAHLVTCYSR